METKPPKGKKKDNNSLKKERWFHKSAFTEQGLSEPLYEKNENPKNSKSQISIYGILLNFKLSYGCEDPTSIPKQK